MKKDLFKISMILKELTFFSFIAFLLFIPAITFCQDDSLHSVNKKIGEAHCNYGKGDGSFRITLPQLEQIITGKYSQKSLLKILPKYGCEFKLTFGYDDKTREFTVPNYEFTYFYVDNNNNPTGISLKVTIEGNINSKIKYLRIDGISPSTYDNLLNALSKTYLYSGSMSNLFEKHFLNKGKKLLIVLFKNPDSTYSVDI